MSSDTPEFVYPGQWMDSLPTTGEQVVREQWFGMTLRDYFAAKAMQALSHPGFPYSCQETAEIAYRQADAMLAARNKVITEGAAL